MDGFAFGFSEVCGNVGGVGHAVVIRRKDWPRAVKTIASAQARSERTISNLARRFKSFPQMNAFKMGRPKPRRRPSHPQKIFGLFDKPFFGIWFGGALCWRNCLRGGFSGSDAQDADGEAESAHGRRGDAKDDLERRAWRKRSRRHGLTGADQSAGCAGRGVGGEQSEGNGRRNAIGFA